jgi:uncharacterized RDD family membrane protein YckC
MTDAFGNPLADEPAQASPESPPWVEPPPPVTIPPGASGPRGGFWRRLVAWIIDSGLWYALTTGCVAALGKGGIWVSFPLGVAYFVLLIGGRRGQTIGLMVMGLRVVSFDTGGPIGYGRAFGRWLVSIVSFWALGIGYLWMLWDKERQCWQDKAARDVVVPLSAYPVS